MSTDLGKLFQAQSIAIVGASNNPRKASHQVILTMLTEVFQGKIYPVHPVESSVLGLKCYPNLKVIQEPLDLVIISVQASAALDSVREAADRGDVSGVIILSAGFSETGDSDLIQLEREIVYLANQSRMRIIGPNCLGIINTGNKLCTGFAPGLNLKPGRLGFVTQSGALGAAFLMLAGAQPEPLGFNKLGHVGNMADVTNLEILELFGTDPEIDVIAMYVEAFRQGRDFINIARCITPEKPVFTLKVGRTALGSRAALSHTGSLAGTDALYDAAFKQSGVVRVKTLEQLLDASKAALMLPMPQGNTIGVLTNAGGPGIIAMDEIGQSQSLVMASLSEATKRSLKTVLPAMAVIGKPDGYVDMTAAAMEKEHAEALQILLDDPGVDSAILISLPPTFLPAFDVAVKCLEVIKQHKKPVAVCMMRGAVMDEARKYFESHGIPTFDTPDRAACALNDLVRSMKARN